MSIVPKRPQVYPAKIRAFTLLEVVLAMAILTLVVIGVHRIIAATMQASADVRESRVRTQELTAFVGLLRETLRTLPASAEIECKPDEDAGRYLPMLTLRNAPAAFAFGKDAVFFGKKTLATAQQLGGLYRIELVLETEDEQGTLRDEKALPPVPLLGSVRKIAWKFWMPEQNDWVEVWDDPQQRPQIVRLELTTAESNTPLIADFWLPSVVQSPQEAPGAGGQATENNTPPEGSPAPKPPRP